jgi:low molecular weight protein-tyrosine phosphatase
MNDRAAGRFLVVCTANQCRSPLAAAILQTHCDALELGVAVDSAGAAAEAGHPATLSTLQAAGGLGLDLSGHRSAPLTPELVAGADLVVTMERRHVQDVVLVDPNAFARTFTLKELVRRGNDAGARANGERFDEWLARVHAGRRPADLLGMSADDDVEDPSGNALADHRTTAAELDALIAALFELLVPTAERGVG